MRRPVVVACAAAAVLASTGVGALPLSQSIARDADHAAATVGNKYLRREATRDSRAPGAAEAEDEDAPRRSSCSAGVSLRWSAEVASSVYATPLLADLFGDGTKQVVVPTFVQYLESLEARAAA